jgi:hypothetical protein
MRIMSAVGVIAVSTMLAFGRVMPASAQMSGTTLYNLCEGNLSEQNFCMAYIMGHYEALFALKHALDSGFVLTKVCPKQTNGTQLRLIFLKWAREHPDDLTASAAPDVFLSLLGTCSPR